MGHDKMPLSQAIQHRRTIYALNKDIPIDDKKIEQIAKHAVLHVPSSFNSQSARLVVLVKEEHDKFWDITRRFSRPSYRRSNGSTLAIVWPDSAPLTALSFSTKRRAQ